MKYFIFSFLFLFLFSGLLFSQKTSVLFIGNSYTYVNDLPTTFKDLSLSLGDTVSTDQSTPGGARFLDHAVNTTTLTKIAAEDWDFVVLQAQSQEPSWSPSQMETEVFPYAEVLVDSIKSNNICTEPVFFMTWGRKYGDDMNCDVWPAVCTLLVMHEK